VWGGCLHRHDVNGQPTVECNSKMHLSRLPPLPRVRFKVMWVRGDLDVWRSQAQAKPHHFESHPSHAPWHPSNHAMWHEP
jgi:hypothetical protein